MNIRASIHAIDAYIGRAICFIFLRSRKRNIPYINNPQTIVFLKLWAIGESVLTLPAIQAISQCFPQATITVLTTAYVAPVFSCQSFIHHVNIIKLNPWSYLVYIIRHWHMFDISIDGEPYLFASAWGAHVLGKSSIGFATCGRSALYSIAIPYNDQQHVVCTYADLAKRMGVTDCMPRTLIPIQYSKEDREHVITYLHAHGITNKKCFMIIAPTVGGSAKGRMWPQECFVAVANDLATQYSIPIILLGSKNDTRMLTTMSTKIASQNIVATNFSLSQAAYIVQQSCLMIANDSGLMHIGATMGTNTLALFGQNTPIRFAPFGPQCTWIYHPCPKSPHINVHKREIPNIQCTCMKNITIKEVIEVAQKILG